MATVAGRLVYRPTLTRFLSLCYLAFGGWWLVALLLGPDPRSAPATAAWLVAFGVVLYALFWRPAVAVDGDGVELVNVVRTVRVPWAALESVDSRYALALHAGGRRYTSWAASAPGRTISVWRDTVGRASGNQGHMLPDARWLPGSTGTERASRDLRSDSGAAAFMVEQGWAGYRDRPASARSDGAPVTVAVHWSRPLIGVVAATWAVALLLGWLL